MRGGVTMTEENEQMSGMKVPKEDFIERLQKASTEIDSIKNSFSKGMDDLARIQSIISLDGVNKLTTMVQQFEDRLIDAERKREEASEGARKFSTELEKEKERLVKLWDAYKNQEEELSMQEKRASELEERLKEVETSKNLIEEDVTARLNTLSQKIEEKDQQIQQLQAFEKQASNFQNAQTQLENNITDLKHEINAKEEMIRSLEVQVEELRQFEQMAEFKNKFDEVSTEYEKEKERLTKLFTLYEETDGENKKLREEVKGWQNWFSSNEELFSKLFSSADHLRRNVATKTSTSERAKSVKSDKESELEKPTQPSKPRKSKQPKKKLRLKK
jgi:chromosome segregation ATPase